VEVAEIEPLVWRVGVLVRQSYSEQHAGQPELLLERGDDRNRSALTVEHRRLTEAQLDTACQAIADFTDIKSPYTLGHSTGVAALAAEAARRCGLPADDVIAIRRTGLLHDIGRVGVSAGIWGKPGPLTSREWEQVRLHPYHTERILARPAALARLGALAALHHERLDGSGYHRAAPASIISLQSLAICVPALVPRRHDRWLLRRIAQFAIALL